jgi:hypothetical protein
MAKEAHATQQRATESMHRYTRDITRQHCKDHVAAAHIILHPLIHVPKLYNCHKKKKTSSMYLYTGKKKIKPAGNKYVYSV